MCWQWSFLMITTQHSISFLITMTINTNYIHNTNPHQNDVDKTCWAGTFTQRFIWDSSNYFCESDDYYDDLSGWRIRNLGKFWNLFRGQEIFFFDQLHVSLATLIRTLVPHQPWGTVYIRGSCWLIQAINRPGLSRTGLLRLTCKNIQSILKARSEIRVLTLATFNNWQQIKSPKQKNTILYKNLRSY